MYTII